uniref:UBX domain-containing protein n=1 Tax=Cannabis sativa TaxID=3483 RepID=A0ABL6UVP3_CANSA
MNLFCIPGIDKRGCKSSGLKLYCKYKMHLFSYKCIQFLFYHSSLRFLPLQEPEKRKVPFQGVGRTLGSTSASAEPTIASPAAPTTPAAVIVDETLPSTSVQLRLADGTRTIGRFNYHHTVNDIRSFIDGSRPGESRNYQLQVMGFPPKLLNDPQQTIEQAGLANSVVIQKF